MDSKGKKRASSPPPAAPKKKSSKPDPKKQKLVVTNTTLAPPPFKIGDEKAKEYLAENGFVVFSDVIDDTKNDKAVGLLWDWLEGLGTGIKRNNVDTWANKQWPEMFVNGIFERYGIGQSEFMWYLRHECRNVYEFLCDTQDLLCSMDGCSFFRPWANDFKWKTVGGWWHFDCSKNVKPELSVATYPDCIQGALCLTAATAASGGFACVPKSHLEWEGYFETHKDKTMGHWVPLDPDLAVSCS